MSAVNLEAILNSSNGEVDCILEPDDNVFFGPVTEREREMRRPLPRKTLHPCEIAQLSKKGMTFNEWIDFKEQVHEMNDKAIEEVYGLDEDTTESFASCCTTADEESKQDIGSSVNTSELTAAESCVDNSQHNQSAAGSLNDTWEIQERMLALAEKLERGEDIPELGICRHSSGKVEYFARLSKSHEIDQIENDNSVEKHSRDNIAHNNAETLEVVIDKPDHAQEQEVVLTSNMDVSNNIAIKISCAEESINESNSLNKMPNGNFRTMLHERKTKSVEELAKEMDCLFLAESLSESPVKEHVPEITSCLTPVTGSGSTRIIAETPLKTPSGSDIKHRSTPILSGSVKKSAVKSSVRSKNPLVACSPVGMYIRSLPEPILIENVRSARKNIQSSPKVNPVSVAVKNKEGRWSVVRTPRQSNTSSNQDQLSNLENIKPVLPTVLHEAAASLQIDDKAIATPKPGTRGKIGKLLERGVTPIVMKHNGRIQVSKDTVDPKIVHSPKSKKAMPSSSTLEVSVLEAMNVPKRYTPIKTPASARK